MKWPLTLTAALALSSCQEQKMDESIAVRDKVLKGYLDLAHQSGKIDSTDANFKMLLAYTHNDSLQLNEN